MAASQAGENFSLVLGGPLYQLLLKLRLCEAPIGLVERRIGAAIAITWLPVLLLTLLAGTALGGATIPFFHDVSAHARLLIALPLLIAAEPVIHAQLQRQVGQFLERGLVEDRSRFARIVDDLMRVRNSITIELVLLAAALGAGHWIWREEFAARVSAWYLFPDETLTAAGAWYAFVSLGLFRFVLFRWLFRLALWYLFLWRVSRLPLRLNALHPDAAGGLGFLAASLGAVTPVLLALSATVAGVIGGQLLHEGGKLPEFYLEIGATVALLACIGVAPLLFFGRALFAAGLEAKRTYGLLSMRYVDEFREKWLRGRASGSEPLIGSADIQSLADLTNAHELTQRIKVVPIDLKGIVRFAVVLALPFAPLALTMIPLNELVGRVLRALL